MWREIFQFVFLSLGVCGLLNMVITPWVHAWELHRLATRVEQLEIAMQSTGGDDDPDDGEPIIKESNVVAFGRVA